MRDSITIWRERMIKDRLPYMVEQFHQGVSIMDISKAMGCSYEHIRGLLAPLGLTMPNRYAQERQRLKGQMHETLISSDIDCQNDAVGRVNLSTIVTSDGRCFVDECGRLIIARGMCTKHYQQWRQGIDMEEQWATDLEGKFWARVVKGQRDECWVWTGSVTELGYGLIYIKTKKTYAHRYSYWLHHGSWPVPMCLHRCDNPMCVNPHHLYEGTHQDNMRDVRVRGRGTKLKGSQVGTSKLTEQDVQEIKKSMRDGAASGVLKDKYDISYSTLSHIRRNLSWRHVVI